MAAALGSSGVQPPGEDWLDPVMTVDVLGMSIEEKSNQQVERVQAGAEWSLLVF
jgi:hypothetical protein